MRALLPSFALLVGAACNGLLTVPPASATPTASSAAATPRAAQQVRFAEYFELTAPPGWTVDARPYAIDWATTRVVTVSDETLEPYRPTGPARIPELDWSRVPRERVVVQVQQRCRQICQGPAEETGFPLDWTAAKPGLTHAGGPGFDVREVGLRFMGRQLFVVVSMGGGATAAAAAQALDVVRSIRPDAPPLRGRFHEFTAVGLERDLRVGDVREDSGFFLVRGRSSIYAFPKSWYTGTPLACLIRYEAATDEFVCDARVLRWSRFGNFRGTAPASNLIRSPTLVRDGILFVSDATHGAAPDVDESAER